MVTTAPSEHNTAKQDAAATACAQNILKSTLKVDGLGEIVDRQTLWTELRSVYTAHMRVYQDFTVLTIAAKSNGTQAGWMLDKRKTDSIVRPLPDPVVEAAARKINQIESFHLVGIKQQPLDEKHAMAVATFQNPPKTDSYDVYVNQSTTDVIGYLPTPVKPSPITLSDAQAEMIESLAWKWLENELATKASDKVVAKARSILKLSPLAATRDGDFITRAFRVWRFFTLCDVSIDEKNNEVVGWFAEALKNNAPDKKITEATAIEAVRPELKASVGVLGPKVTFDTQGKDHTVTVYWWHVEKGLNIEGDHTTVMLNATTGKVYSVARKWRKISADVFKAPLISLEQAFAAADAAIKREPGSPPGKDLGLSIIEVSPTPDKPSNVRDVQVRRIGYSGDGGLRFTEVAVDTQTGEVVRITGW